MKVKHFTAGLLSLVILFMFCACGADKPLYEQDGESPKPERMNVTVDKEDISSSLYDIADEELMSDITDALCKIKTGKKVKSDGFKAEYTLELFGNNGEKTVLGFSGDMAEITEDGEKSCYKISRAEELFDILTEEAKTNEETMLGYDKIIDSENLTVYVKKELGFDESGNPAVDMYVINRMGAITVGIDNCTVNGKKAESEKSEVAGESEAGFVLPIKAQKEIKEISFSVFAANGTGENIEPFIQSEKYIIKAN